MAAGLALVLLAGSAAAKEPPLRIEIEVGGQRLSVNAGEPAVVNIDGKPIPMTVRALPFRRFEVAGLRFDYPLSMGFEESDDPPLWTLDGNDCTVMVNELLDGDDTTPTSLLASFAARLKWKADAPAAAVTLTTRLAGTVSGVQQTFRLVTHRSYHESFLITPPGSPRVLLTLQDTLDDAGNHSTEFVAARQRLQATLEFFSQ